jgi:hypothetical protein
MQEEYGVFNPDPAKLVYSFVLAFKYSGDYCLLIWLANAIGATGR